MRLLHLTVRSQADASMRGVSVWVDADDPGEAGARAGAGLAAAGWTVISVDTEEETRAEDYFRACPSQQAFTRAQTEGLAWRFDDE